MEPLLVVHSFFQGNCELQQCCHHHWTKNEAICATANHVPRFKADRLSDLANCNASWLEACTDVS